MKPRALSDTAVNQVGLRLISVKRCHVDLDGPNRGRREPPLVPGREHRLAADHEDRIHVDDLTRGSEDMLELLTLQSAERLQ